MKPLRRHSGPKDLRWLLDSVSPEPNSGCWLWMGALDSKGYANTQVGSAFVGAHRHAWSLANGPIPRGLEVDHKCRVRCCVNPDHLEPVQHRENMLRGDTIAAKNVAKSECPSGHPYDGRNVAVSSRGYRKCRECNRLRAQAHRRRTRLSCQGASA